MFLISHEIYIKYTKYRQNDETTIETSTIKRLGICLIWLNIFLILLFSQNYNIEEGIWNNHFPSQLASVDDITSYQNKDKLNDGDSQLPTKNPETDELKKHKLNSGRLINVISLDKEIEEIIKKDHSDRKVVVNSGRLVNVIKLDREKTDPLILNSREDTKLDVIFETPEINKLYS